MSVVGVDTKHRFLKRVVVTKRQFINQEGEGLKGFLCREPGWQCEANKEDMERLWQAYNTDPDRRSFPDSKVGTFREGGGNFEVHYFDGGSEFEDEVYADVRYFWTFVDAIPGSKDKRIIRNKFDTSDNATDVYIAVDLYQHTELDIPPVFYYQSMIAYKVIVPRVFVAYIDQRRDRDDADTSIIADLVSGVVKQVTFGAETAKQVFTQIGLELWVYSEAHPGKCPTIPFNGHIWLNPANEEGIPDAQLQYAWGMFQIVFDKTKWVVTGASESVGEFLKYTVETSGTVYNAAKATAGSVLGAGSATAVGVGDFIKTSVGAAGRTLLAIAGAAGSAINTMFIAGVGLAALYILANAKST